MNERDIEIMSIADDLLVEQRKLINQQSRVIETLTELLRVYGKPSVVYEDARDKVNDG